MPLDEITDTGTAPEEEIPQEEVVEEVNEEVVEEEEMSAEQVDVWDKLGLDTDEVAPVVEEKAVEQEEVVEATKEHEPPPESKRFKQIYWENKEKDRLLTEANARIAALETNVAPVQEPAPDLPPVPDQSEVKITELKAQVTELKKAKRAARDDFDTDKEDSIDDQIDELKDELFNEKYKQPVIDPQKITEDVQRVQAVANYKVAARNFTADNPWFVQRNPDGSANKKHNNEMAIMAVDLEKELSKTWDGTPQDLFKEISTQVATAYPAAVPKSKKSGVASVNVTRDVKPTKTPANIDANTSKMLKGIFGDDTESINRVIESSQKQGVA